MKILLLDADGVVLKKGEYFSTYLSNIQEVPEADVVDFFKNEYLLCQSGQADLKVVIESYLKKWKWSKSVDELLELWFEYDTNVNETVTKKIKELRERGVECYMASNNEKYRAEHIKKVLDGRNLLDGYFFSSGLGVRKSNPEFFRKILEDLNALESDIFYLDNDEENLTAAGSLGIESKLFLEEEFNKL